MSTLITSIEHSLAVAASDTVKVAKFVETSVFPVLKKAQANRGRETSFFPMRIVRIEDTIDQAAPAVVPYP